MDIVDIAMLLLNRIELFVCMSLHFSWSVQLRGWRSSWAPCTDASGVTTAGRKSSDSGWEAPCTAFAMGGNNVTSWLYKINKLQLSFLLEQSIKKSIHEYLTTTLSLKYHEKITDDIQEALGDLPLHKCIAMLWKRLRLQTQTLKSSTSPSMAALISSSWCSSSWWMTSDPSTLG